MKIFSILYPDGYETTQSETNDVPEYFLDLNLDQVIDAITLARQEYNLTTYYFSPLNSIQDILYRQDVFRNLADDELFHCIQKYSENMVIVRRYLSLAEQLDSKYHIRYHMEGWVLEAADLYCETIKGFFNDLNQCRLFSKGMISIRDYVKKYLHTPEFEVLQKEVNELQAKLKTIRYCLAIKENAVRVRKFEDEIDYSQVVEKTFEKFRQGEVKNYLIKLNINSGMSTVEERALRCVAALYPEIFAELDAFFLKNREFLDETIRLFDRQIQFYMAYLEFSQRIRTKHLDFCIPEVSQQEKNIEAENSFDIALANKLIYEKEPVICNDFYLDEPERVIVISGPNQGGKTTFARMFGQVHFLASLGCPVPGSKAKLFLFDQLFTHFEKEEDIRNLRGKLQDEIVRIHSILERATSNSIIVMNEIFTSTALVDAVFLSKEIVNKIIQKDAICVCVSFIDELSTISNQTVSMVSTIVPDDPAVRTFKIIRKPADGLSYAMSIAEKYHLMYQQIKGRIQS